jgi:surface antigen
MIRFLGVAIVVAILSMPSAADAQLVDRLKRSLTEDLGSSLGGQRERDEQKAVDLGYDDVRRYRQDLSLIREAESRALAAPLGRGAEWEGRTGNFGTTIPLRDFRTPDGYRCRELRQMMQINGQRHDYMGALCLVGTHWVEYR